MSGGGHTSQIYAVRQAIAKSIVAYYQKYVDEYAKNQLKSAFVQFDRTLLVADNRRCEPKKFGGMSTQAIRRLVRTRCADTFAKVPVPELAIKNHTDEVVLDIAALDSVKRIREIHVKLSSILKLDYDRGILTLFIFTVVFIGVHIYCFPVLEFQFSFGHDIARQI